MLNVIRPPIKEAFAAGQAACADGLPLSENPFSPGGFDYTQWVLGHQWGLPGGKTRAVNRGARL